MWLSGSYPVSGSRVCNPGLTEPENPGNPDFFQTRNPGLNGLPNLGFRVWFFYFSLCCFIVICVSSWVNWFNKTTTYKGDESLTRLSLLLLDLLTRLVGYSAVDSLAINLSSSQAVKCVCVCVCVINLGLAQRRWWAKWQSARSSDLFINSGTRTHAIRRTPIT